jgi:hypothetical protein
MVKSGRTSVFDEAPGYPQKKKNLANLHLGYEEAYFGTPRKRTNCQQCNMLSYA